MKWPGNPVYRIVAVRGGQASFLALLAHWLLGWPLWGPHALGLWVTPLLCLYFVFVFYAPWTWGLPILTRLKTRKKVVALTFDDGPSLEVTPAVLDTLRVYGVRATFFVLGAQAARHPEILRRIVAEGHALGVHGYQHRPLALASAEVVRREIEQTRDLIAQLAPDAPALHFFRPPYGFKNARLPFLARSLNCRMTSWTLNSHDYQAKTLNEITGAVLPRLKPGAIVLLHDGADNHKTALALPLLLRGLRTQGYEAVRLAG